jgi:hypothetical protein
MLTDPQIVLARLGRYPNLSICIRRKWVRSAAANPSIATWHVFFEEEESIASEIIGNIDNVIGNLGQRNVEGLKTCAEGLCSPTMDGFWSSFTELVQGSKLCASYPMRYLSKQAKQRTPDIELTTSNGPVYVEITAMHKTWDFRAIQRYIHTALGDLQHTYRINVKCSSDTIKIAEELLKELAERIRAHIVAKPFPADGENELLFSSMDGRIAVSLRRSDLEGHGYVVSSTGASAGQSPQAHFKRIVKRLSDDKAFQVANYRPSVVVIELANDSSGMATWAALIPYGRYTVRSLEWRRSLPLWISSSSHGKISMEKLGATQER